MNNTEDKIKQQNRKFNITYYFFCYNQGIQQMRHCDQIKNNIVLLQT